MSSVTTTGIYFGYAQVSLPETASGLCTDDLKVWPMVMSLGWNPYYKNEKLTAVEWSDRSQSFNHSNACLTGSAYNA